LDVFDQVGMVIAVGIGVCCKGVKNGYNKNMDASKMMSGEF